MQREIVLLNTTLQNSICIYPAHNQGLSTDLLLPAGAVGAGQDWQLDGSEDLHVVGDHPAGLGL